MPIYEFACSLCRETREELTTVSSPPPICCEQEMVRLLSSFAFKIDGQFYPKNDLELDNFLKQHGKAPVFESGEHREKTEWAVKQARTGDLDKTV